MKLDFSKIDQPTIIKAVIILVLVIAFYFIIRKVLKNIKNDRYGNAVNSEIKPGELSYPLNQYIALADQLHDAMAYLGTDNSAVVSVISKMNNLSDILQLIKAFGVRPYYGLFGDKTLPQWFQEELSAKETADVNTILKTKNINFSF
jgi:hypothetical protein